MFAFLYNLFVVAAKVPTAITIIKKILDLVGSDAVKEILRLVSDTIQTDPVKVPAQTDPPAERKRLLDRLKLRLGQRFLGLNDFQLSQTLKNVGRAGEAQNA
ncbi:MAG: hypothetical protein FWE95_06185 [Planctomycetaceae bacterium]|nr:hypothetical protein [Planctomycetaceae bacterium]